MTSVEVSAPRAAPADGSGKGSARLDVGGGFDEADARFSQQLASAAADADGTASTSVPQPADSAGVAIVRWWRQQARIDASQAVSGQIPSGQQHGPAASVLLAGKDPNAAVAECPGHEAEPEDGDASETKTADPAVRIAAVLAAASATMPAVVATTAAVPQNLPQAPADPQVPARPEVSLPTSAKDGPAVATPRTVDVKVVGTETHLAPALRVLPATPSASKPTFMERVAQRTTANRISRSKGRSHHPGCAARARSNP